MQRKSCVRWSCAVAAVPTITDTRLSLSKKSLDVTSRFFGKKVSRWSEKSPNLVTKLLNWQHAHLYFSTLSLYDCSSTRVFKRTHTYRNIWTTANQRGVRPSLSLIGSDQDMGLMCVCCWTTGRLSESQRLFFSWTVGRTIEKLGQTKLVTL